MDDRDLEKMSKNLNIDDKDERASVITQDRLKKFNEIYGYENGPAVDHENEEDEEGEGFNHEDELLSNPNEGEEQRDEVHSLASKNQFQSQGLLKGRLARSQNDK